MTWAIHAANLRHKPEAKESMEESATRTEHIRILNLKQCLLQVDALLNILMHVLWEGCRGCYDAVCTSIFSLWVAPSVRCLS